MAHAQYVTCTVSSPQKVVWQILQIFFRFFSSHVSHEGRNSFSGLWCFSSDVSFLWLLVLLPSNFKGISWFLLCCNVSLPGRTIIKYVLLYMWNSIMFGLCILDKNFCQIETWNWTWLMCRSKVNDTNWNMTILAKLSRSVVVRKLCLVPWKFRNYDPLTTTRVHTQLNYK